MKLIEVFKPIVMNTGEELKKAFDDLAQETFFHGVQFFLKG